MVRAAFIDKNGMKKGAWSKEEDNKLRSYVLRFGHLNWRLVPKHAGMNRCGKSCRLRWMNYLKPDVKRGNITREEGELIKTLYDKLGSKWSAIATSLPGRTDNEIKNYWHTHFNIDKRRRRSTADKSSVTKISEDKMSSESSTAVRWMNCPNSSEFSGTTQEKSNEMACDDVYILESSSSSSRSNSVVSVDFELDSIVNQDWCEMLSQPSDSVGFNWGGDDGASCSSDSLSGFQESYVVDTSYIQEFDFSLFEDFESSFNQVVGFDDGNDIKLF